MGKIVIIHIICGLAYVAGAVWGIFEGLDYLINHDPANWNFLFPLIGGIVGAVGNMLFAFFKN
jgi:hypothetical protein